jgi:hypothetical protein
MQKPEQLAGGRRLCDESRGEVSAKETQSSLGARDLTVGISRALQGPLLGFAVPHQAPVCGSSITTNCDRLPARGQSSDSGGPFTAQGQRGESLRAVDIKLDVQGWVKNVLVPALVDEFIEENGKAAG